MPSGSVVSPDATIKSPKPGLQLYLNKPNANSSSISLNDIALPSTPGLRAHIGHLLPRSTYFRAKVNIHQISSVPFVSGEFGVRWKFKSVQAPAVQKPRLLDRVKARASEKKVASDKGKGREEAGEAQASDDRVQGLPLVPTQEGHVGVRQVIGNGRSASGSSVASTDRGTPSLHTSLSSRSSQAGHSQQLSVDWATSTSSHSTNSSTITVAPTSPATTPSDSSTTPAILPLANVNFTPARGITPFLPLKSHSVVWSQMLDPVLKFYVDRETAQVMPSPFKLVVMQRATPDDPTGSPKNSRLGAVYLNLSEYIGQGSVERRYLLKESKTNATLKLTIEMEYVSGETHYIPPPLAKGEILTGLAGFLEHDVVKKRPRALDIYGPYNDQQELEIDLLGAEKSSKPLKTAKSTRSSDKDQHSTDSESGGEGVEEQVGVVFDVQRLPLAYGTKTTEALIDALFNPVKITEKRDESPFTIYDPLSPGITPTVDNRTPKAAAHNGGGGIGLGMTGVPLDRRAPTLPKRNDSMASSFQDGGGGGSSIYSTSSESASMHTTTSESAKSVWKESGGSQSESHHGHQGTLNGVQRGTPGGRVVVGPSAAEEMHVGGVRGWWRRHTRPATPTQASAQRA